MKTYFLLSLFAALFALPAFAQTSPVDPADQDVVKISTNVIQLDVTVTDRRGNPLRDLKPEDFEVYENGEKQKITGFSFVSSQKTTGTNSSGAAASSANDVRLRPEQVRRTFALVVDDLSLSFQSVASVRKSLKKFVDEQMQAGDLVAIFRTGAGIGALQQFTGDRRRLQAAIEKIRWNPRGTGGVGAFAPIERLDLETDARNLNPEADRDFADERDDAQRGVSDIDFYDYRESSFVSGTLGALDYIIRGMRELPGRKSVLLVSDGFKLYSEKLRGGVEDTRVSDSLRRLTDLANRSSVVIYTIDARGLQTASITAEDNTVGVGVINSPFSRPDAARVRTNELRSTQDGLIYLATKTGGFPFLNKNDLNQGIARVLADQSYYLIAYEPDSETFDPKKRQFNEIKISVNRKDAEDVRYRSGFFGVSDERIAARRADLPAQQRLAQAIVSPFADDSIAVRLNPIFGSDGRNDSSFVRSLVFIDTRDLQFTDEPNGGKKAVFDILAASFGDNGTLLDHTGTTYTLSVKKESFDKFIEKGFVYYFSYPVKKPGVYQYRVAVLDANSKRIGSATHLIEVPNLESRRLLLSGVMLENLSPEDWKNRLAGKSAPPPPSQISNPLAHTSIREFKPGTVLRYGFEIYNARRNAGGKPDLSAKIRLIREGEIILDGRQNPVDFDDRTDPARIPYSGGFNLGEELPAGEYILQIIVTDNLAKEKQNTAAQFIQFEIVK